MPSIPLKYDAQGLLPAIVQDHLTGEIRMFAFASDAAVRNTIETGRATFWSRSRGELWQKGRISGHEVPVIRVLADCDGDSVIYSSEPGSPSCHSGAQSCFFQAVDGDRLVQASDQPQTLLAALEASVDADKRARGETSYVRPIAAGSGEKLREEVSELAMALENDGDERVVSEAADLVYELVVALRSRSIGVRRVLAELARRLGRGSADDGANQFHAQGY